jgi:hypothetical protein
MEKAALRERSPLVITRTYPVAPSTGAPSSCKRNN